MQHAHKHHALWLTDNMQRRGNWRIPEEHSRNANTARYQENTIVEDGRSTWKLQQCQKSECSTQATRYRMVKCSGLKWGTGQKGIRDSMEQGLDRMRHSGHERTPEAAEGLLLAGGV